MNNVPNNLQYAASHEWVRLEDEGIAWIGITEFAQGELGDVVYVELPEIGATVTAGVEAAVVESVKAASDIYSPVSGQVIEVNQLLEEAPELVNESSYDKAWFFKVKIDDASELDALLTHEGYADLTSSE
jgi:glycine cleavage system H protein